MTASDILWMLQIGIIGIFWLCCIIAGIVAFVRAKDRWAFFRIESLSGVFQAIGFTLLLFAVFCPIMLTLDRLLPARRFHRYVFGVDDNGESFDRRIWIAGILTIVITYLLIRGWRAHRERP